MIETLVTAAEQVEAVLPENEGIQEVVVDKGYHSTERIVDLNRLGLGTYISEPKRKRRHWKEGREAQAAVYENRRRIRRKRGKALLRQRGERLERPFAHLYETGRMRRTHLRGRENILKRILIHVSASNLGILMRSSFNIGTPRNLQGRGFAFFSTLYHKIKGLFVDIWTIDFILSVSPLRFVHIRVPADF
jgi:transposase